MPRGVGMQNPGRPHEREKLKNVERRKTSEVEPARDGPRMADDRNRAATLMVDFQGIETDARLFR